MKICKLDNLDEMLKTCILTEFDKLMPFELEDVDFKEIDELVKKIRDLLQSEIEYFNCLAEQKVNLDSIQWIKNFNEKRIEYEWYKKNGTLADITIKNKCAIIEDICYKNYYFETFKKTLSAIDILLKGKV